MADSELLSPTVFISSANSAPLIVYPINPSPSSPPVRVKRRQVKVACTNCQRACKKCDEARPCLRCVKYSVPHACVDAKRKARRKGIKRGPYKKHKEKNRSMNEESGESPTGDTGGSVAEHELHIPDRPAPSTSTASNPLELPAESGHHQATTYEQFEHPVVSPPSGTHQKPIDDPTFYAYSPQVHHHHQYGYHGPVHPVYSPQQTPYYQPQVYQLEAVYEPHQLAYYPVPTQSHYPVHHRPEPHMTQPYMYQYPPRSAQEPS
ncbi:hypothetical protein PM082_012685 [Marasmius tenuissimus]|nr:hypothetical protein PM082_012685 [Marasmius tenuissimus]